MISSLTDNTYSFEVCDTADNLTLGNPKPDRRTGWYFYFYEELSTTNVSSFGNIFTFGTFPTGAYSLSLRLILPSQASMFQGLLLLMISSIWVSILPTTVAVSHDYHDQHSSDAGCGYRCEWHCILTPKTGQCGKLCL
ncbi:MAG: hypothetical protein R3B47_06890 [Bacteroidia bacterium]